MNYKIVSKTVRIINKSLYPNFSVVSAFCNNLSTFLWGPLYYYRFLFSLKVFIFLQKRRYCNYLKTVTIKFMKITQFHLISCMEILWKGTVLALFRANRPKQCGNCPFPQNFYTRKSGKITVFFAVPCLK